MDSKRKVEVFSAGCALCEEVIDVVRREAGSSSEVIVRNMKDARSLARAEELGIRSVPAVVIGVQGGRRRRHSGFEKRIGKKPPKDFRPNNSGSLAMFAAIRRASSFVSSLAADRRPRRAPKAISAIPKSWKSSPHHDGGSLTSSETSAALRRSPSSV